MSKKRTACGPQQHLRIVELQDRPEISGSFSGFRTAVKSPVQFVRAPMSQMAVSRPGKGRAHRGHFRRPPRRGRQIVRNRVGNSMELVFGDELLGGTSSPRRPRGHRRRFRRSRFTFPSFNLSVSRGRCRNSCFNFSRSTTTMERSTTTRRREMMTTMMIVATTSRVAMVPTETIRPSSRATTTPTDDRSDEERRRLGIAPRRSTDRRNANGTAAAATIRNHARGSRCPEVALESSSSTR